jgi:hypothetical protein
MTITQKELAQREALQRRLANRPRPDWDQADCGIPMMDEEYEPATTLTLTPQDVLYLSEMSDQIEQDEYERMETGRAIRGLVFSMAFGASIPLIIWFAIWIGGKL